VAAAVREVIMLERRGVDIAQGWRRRSPLSIATFPAASGNPVARAASKAMVSNEGTMD
jgi:hypothetical protein